MPLLFQFPSAFFIKMLYFLPVLAEGFHLHKRRSWQSNYHFCWLVWSFNIKQSKIYRIFFSDREIFKWADVHRHQQLDSLKLQKIERTCNKIYPLSWILLSLIQIKSGDAGLYSGAGGHNIETAVIWSVNSPDSPWSPSWSNSARRAFPAAISLLSIYPPLLVQPTSCTTLFEALRNEIETCSNLADFWFCPTLRYNQHFFICFYYFTFFSAFLCEWYKVSFDDQFMWLALCRVGHLVVFLCKLNLFVSFQCRVALFFCVFSVA